MRPHSAPDENVLTFKTWFVALLYGLFWSRVVAGNTGEGMVTLP